MKSLFNQTDSNEIIDRIKNLHPNSKAEWGKMSVSQMMAHLQQPIKVSQGDLKLKRGLIGFLFGAIAKKKLLGAQDFQKNLPTDPHFIIKDEPDFEHTKDQLIVLVQRFTKSGAAGLSKDPHPFFGKLTTEEWDLLNWKHLDHHLRQFKA